MQLDTKKLIDKLHKIVFPIVDKMEYELIDIEFLKEASEWYLRVYIDKTGGITIDDCEALSNELSETLDNNDPIPHSYILEVSSPGLDRPLVTDADFVRYKGELIEVYINNSDNAGVEDVSTAENVDKGNVDKGNVDKGNVDKGNVDKGNVYKGNVYKGNVDKGNVGKQKRKGKYGGKRIDKTIIEGILLKREEGVLYLLDMENKTIELDVGIVDMVKRAIRFN